MTHTKGYHQEGIYEQYKLQVCSSVQVISRDWNQSTHILGDFVKIQPLGKGTPLWSNQGNQVPAEKGDVWCRNFKSQHLISLSWKSLCMDHALAALCACLAECADCCSLILPFCISRCNMHWCCFAKPTKFPLKQRLMFEPTRKDQFPSQGCFSPCSSLDVFVQPCLVHVSHACRTVLECRDTWWSG